MNRRLAILPTAGWINTSVFTARQHSLPCRALC